MYFQVDVIVDGTLDSAEEVATWEEVEAIAETAAMCADSDGLLTEVYVIRHEHASDCEECSCAQYLTDHHPEWTFGEEATS